MSTSPERTPIQVTPLSRDFSTRTWSQAGVPDWVTVTIALALVLSAVAVTVGRPGTAAAGIEIENERVA
jgi:hypothetical protein